MLAMGDIQVRISRPTGTVKDDSTVGKEVELFTSLMKLKLVELLK